MKESWCNHAPSDALILGAGIFGGLALDECCDRLPSGDLSFVLIKVKTQPLGERYKYTYGRAPSSR